MGQINAVLFQTPSHTNSPPSPVPFVHCYCVEKPPPVSSCPLFCHLFLFPHPSGLTVLTAPMISSCLSKIIMGLGLNLSHFRFHSFKRSGVSWAADHNVPLQNLKAHGGWSSSAINCYLTHTPLASSTVATTFQRLLNH